MSTVRNAGAHKSSGDMNVSFSVWIACTPLRTLVGMPATLPFVRKGGSSRLTNQCHRARVGTTSLDTGKLSSVAILHWNPKMNTEHNLSEIRQIAVTVSDVGTALAFYRDVLGLKFLFSPAPTLAFLAAGSVRIMLTIPQGAGTVGHNSILYFTVIDIAATHTAIVERGATSEREPALAAKMPDHELWISFLRDPDSNLIGLMEERR